MGRVRAVVEGVQEREALVWLDLLLQHVTGLAKA